VNHLADYDLLRDDNVLSAKHVLEFAAASDRKIPIYYASSLAIFSNYETDAEVNELTPVPDTPTVVTGYIQTKWAAEHMFAAARERGFPVTIFRLGFISGDEATGKVNFDDFLWRAVRVMLNLNKAPEARDPIYLTPVDFAARAIRALCDRDDAAQQTYHIVGDGSTSLNDIMVAAEGLSGQSVTRVDKDEWASLLSQQTGHAELTALSPYLAAYPEFASFSGGSGGSLAKFPPVSIALTQDRLGEEGVRMNIAMSDVLTKYLARLVDGGAPESVRANERMEVD
jgi:thioester reductase-like protein